MSIPADPIEGYYAQQTDTSTRDLMGKDKGLTRPPTARELLALMKGPNPVYSGNYHRGAEPLRDRVAAVLALIDFRWQVPAEVIVAQIRRILDGEKA